MLFNKTEVKVDEEKDTLEILNNEICFSLIHKKIGISSTFVLASKKLLK